MSNHNESVGSVATGNPGLGTTRTKGIPKDLVVKIKDSYRVSLFVETGTYWGSTVKWASTVFPRLATIERSEYYYELLRPKHAQYPGIDFVFGDSRRELPRLVSSLTGPAVFWLDGHWSCEHTYGEGDECPLLREIEAISQSQYEHFLFIDDARLFLSPPPKPHLRSQWPGITEVIDALRRGGRNPYIVVFADVIMASPRGAEPLLAQWCQEAASEADEMLRQQQMEANVRQGVSASAPASPGPKSLRRRIAERFMRLVPRSARSWVGRFLLRLGNILRELH